MKPIDKYTEFLHSKISLAVESGFEVSPQEVNPILKPHQRDIVQWAIRGGCRRQQNHVCPLQLDIVERIINRYSNPGDVVFDPFGGIGTVPYMAVKMGRRGLSTELNTDYYRDSLRYLREAEESAAAPTLFDLIN